MKTYRILFTGGGSGGHIYPLVGVLEELYSLAAQGGFQFESYYLGPSHALNKELAKRGVGIWSITSSKYRSYGSIENILDIPKFIFSLFEAFVKMYMLMPDVVFSKGGPGALAVIIMARFYHIPVIIHDSDAVPGLTNRASARFAQKIGIAFAGAAEYFSAKEKLALVGNPIRPEFTGNLPSQSLGRMHFQLNPQDKVVLVLGGSLGSTRINDFILDNLADILSLSQLVHQVGVKNFDQVKTEADVMLQMTEPLAKHRYKIVSFLEAEEMRNALSAADVVISRAGAGAIFEIASFGKPAILIPLEESANGHQKANAYEYAQTGAAIVIEEPNLLNTLFMNQLRRLLESPDILKTMSSAALSFAKPKAAQKIAEEILKLTVLA